MAFLSPAFTNDIFLSYARADNLCPPGAPGGWVDLFKATLEVELSRLIGEVGIIRIWMDKRGLDSNHFFDDEIERQIKESGLFLALTSRGYVRPNSYCLKELALFHKKARTPPETLRVGTRSRIFNGLLFKFNHTEWPRELAGTSEATLYETNIIESGDPSSVGEKTFETQVKGLAGAIYSTLCEYKRALESAAPAPPPPEPGPAEEEAPAVFLADTVEGLSELRESVLARLEEEGITVAAEMPPPYPPDHDDEARKAMGAATLSVHLLDASPGKKFIDKSRSKTFLERQAEIGLEHAKSQYVWLPPSPRVEIPSVKPDAYREFLEGLEARECDKDRYAFARVYDSGVPDEIVKRFRHLTAPKPAASAAGTDAAALLETHRKDQLHAAALYQLLVNESYTTYINPEEDDPGKNVGRLQELAREVSVFVIIFCKVTPDWVVERLNSCLQAASAVDPPRLKLCGIYSPPDGEEEARRKSLRVPPVEIPIIYSTQPAQLLSKIDQYAGGDR